MKKLRNINEIAVFIDLQGLTSLWYFNVFSTILWWKIIHIVSFSREALGLRCLTRLLQEEGAAAAASEGCSFALFYQHGWERATDQWETLLPPGPSWDHLDLLCDHWPHRWHHAVDGALRAPRKGQRPLVLSFSRAWGRSQRTLLVWLEESCVAHDWKI